MLAFTSTQYHSDRSDRSEIPIPCHVYSANACALMTGHGADIVHFAVCMLPLLECVLIKFIDH